MDNQQDELRKTVLAYLQNHNVLTLATHGSEGLWAAAVFYVHEQFNLYFLSAGHTRHSRNIAACSSVSATIQEDYREWKAIKGIQLEGACSLLEGAERDRIITLYGKKFPIIGSGAPLEITKALSKVGWYKIAPDRLFFIDNSRGLGNRDELMMNIR